MVLEKAHLLLALRPYFIRCLDKRERYIEQLHIEYENDNIVLFLGAGASRDAKIATWDNLIFELFVALIDRQLKTNHI